jgi:hypothetical protein
MTMDWFMRSNRPAWGAKSRDYALILMLAAVAGAASQVVSAILNVGRSAGWWH